MSQLAQSPNILQWTRFLEGLPPGNEIRQLIIESWQRSAAAGVEQHPTQITLHCVSDEELCFRLESNRGLIDIAAPHLESVSAVLNQVEHVIYLTDHDGIVLYSTGNCDEMRECGLLPGYDWSEKRMGTNGAGTALVTGQLVAIIGAEHFDQSLGGFT